MTAIDRAGKIIPRGSEDILDVDGVPCSMEVLVAFVNPNPAIYYRGERIGNEVRIFQHDRAGVLAECGVNVALDKLAHGLAYTSATSIVETNCLYVGEGCEDWWDISTDDADSAAVIAESVGYLEQRGLIERHPDRPNLIAMLDESEAR
jgi:hypothetical protein